MDRTQGLYNKAKRIIPGGTQLLSKRPEMFLPGKWPAYYSKAEGCEVIVLGLQDLFRSQQIHPVIVHH